MSDYTKTTNFTAKDALSSGDPNKLILGSLFDTEFDAIQTSNNTKANKVAAGTTNNLHKQDANGDLVDADSISDNGSEVSIATGRTFNVVDASGLKIAGTAITATATELNLLSGVTTVWHSGNDGAASGLDADLLDAQEGSFYTNASNLSSGTVPSARLPAANTTTVGALETATQAEADTGTATDKIMTPATSLGRNGTAVQEVYTLYTTQTSGSTAIPFDNTIPQSSEGDEYITASITPKSATNLLKIEVLVYVSAGSGGQIPQIALFQDTTADALSVASTNISSTSAIYPLSITYWMVAGTTSATTFKVRGGPSAGGTFYINRSGTATLYNNRIHSSLTITEYAV